MRPLPLTHTDATTHSRGMLLEREVPGELPPAVKGELISFLSTLLRKHIPLGESAPACSVSPEDRLSVAQTMLEELAVSIQCRSVSSGGRLSSDDRFVFAAGMLAAMEVGSDSECSLLSAALWGALYATWTQGAAATHPTLEVFRRNPVTGVYERFNSLLTVECGHANIGWETVADPEGYFKGMRSLEDAVAYFESVTLKKNAAPTESSDHTTPDSGDEPDGLVLGIKLPDISKVPPVASPIAVLEVVTMSKATTLTILEGCLDAVLTRAPGATYATPALVLGALVDALALREVSRPRGNIVVPHLPTAALFMKRLGVRCAQTDSVSSPAADPALWGDSLLYTEPDETQTQRATPPEGSLESPAANPVDPAASVAPASSDSATRAVSLHPAAQRQISKARPLDLLSDYSTPATDTPSKGWNFSQHEREVHLKAVADVNSNPPTDEATLKSLFFQLATEDGGPEDKLDKAVLIEYLRRAYPAITDCGDPEYVVRLVHSAHSRPCQAANPSTGRGRRVVDYSLPSTGGSISSWGLGDGILGREIYQGAASDVVNKLDWENDRDGHPLVSKWVTAALHESLAARAKGGAPENPKSITQIYLSKKEPCVPPTGQRVPVPHSALDLPQDLKVASSWLEEGVARRINRERMAERETSTRQARRPEAPPFVTESEFISVIQRLVCKA